MGGARAGGVVLRPAVGAPCCLRRLPSGRSGWPWPGSRWRRSGAAGRSAACRWGGSPSRWSTRPWRRPSRTSGRPASASCSRWSGRGSLRSSWSPPAGWCACAALGAPPAGCWPRHGPGRPRPTAPRRVAAVQGDVPGDGTDILSDHRQVTDNHVDATATSPPTSRRGAAAPDFVIWPENSTEIDPFTTRPCRHPAAVAAIGVPTLVGAMVDDGDEHVLNQGIVWEPGTGEGDVHQAAPGAVRRVHPVAPTSATTSEARLDRPRLEAGHQDPPDAGGRIEVADAICFDVAYDGGSDLMQEGAEMHACRPTTRATSSPDSSSSSSPSHGTERSRPGGGWSSRPRTASPG